MNNDKMKQNSFHIFYHKKNTKKLRYYLEVWFISHVYFILVLLWNELFPQIANTNISILKSICMTL